MVTNCCVFVIVCFVAMTNVSSHVCLGFGLTQLLVVFSRTYSKEDQSILFPVDMTLEGDILVRVRHFAKSGKCFSMIRFVRFCGSRAWPLLKFSEHNVIVLP